MTQVRFSGSLFLSRSRFYNILRLVRLLPMESCRKGRRRGISSVLPFSKIRRNLQRQLRGSYVIIPTVAAQMLRRRCCTDASVHRCIAKRSIQIWPLLCVVRRQPLPWQPPEEEVQEHLRCSIQLAAQPTVPPSVSKLCSQSNIVLLYFVGGLSFTAQFF